MCIKVTEEIYREYMIKKVVPAIRENWPADDLRCIIGIQAGNAKLLASAYDNLEWQYLLVDPLERV